MTVSDKFTRGWIAGTCGGFLGAIFSFIPYYIGFSTLRLSEQSFE
ncbi:MAG TPA: hypothetical protein VF941_05430 [Clostridia bacterium]